jgi:hypothetical protein
MLEFGTPISVARGVAALKDGVMVSVRKGKRNLGSYTVGLRVRLSVRQKMTSAVLGGQTNCHL